MNAASGVRANRRPGVPVEFAQAPLRTVRARDVDVYEHARPQLQRLMRRGLMHRLADGFYAVVPQDRVGEAWTPTIEGAAAGIAAAEFGPRGFALMGLGAARLHRAVPRAVATVAVAAPRRRREIRLADRAGRVMFVPRDLDALGVELLAADLGDCLVTTVEQTVLDLARLPGREGAQHDALAAVRALLPRCEDDELERLAEGQRMHAALRRARQEGATT